MFGRFVAVTAMVKPEETSVLWTLRPHAQTKKHILVLRETLSPALQPVVRPRGPSQACGPAASLTLQNLATCKGAKDSDGAPCAGEDAFAERAVRDYESSRGGTPWGVRGVAAADAGVARAALGGGSCGERASAVVSRLRFEGLKSTFWPWGVMNCRTGHVQLDWDRKICKSVRVCYRSCAPLW